MYLGGFENLAEGPHEGAIDAHQLLLVNLVGLVQHHPYLVIMPPQGADHLQSTTASGRMVHVRLNMSIIFHRTLCGLKRLQHGAWTPSEHGDKLSMDALQTGTFSAWEDKVTGLCIATS